MDWNEMNEDIFDGTYIECAKGDESGIYEYRAELKFFISASSEEDAEDYARRLFSEMLKQASSHGVEGELECVSFAAYGDDDVDA